MQISVLGTLPVLNLSIAIIGSDGFRRVSTDSKREARRSNPNSRCNHCTASPHHTRLNHQRNVVLRRALRNGDDVDIAPAQGAEGSSRNSRQASHSVPDDGHDADIRIDYDVLHLLVGQVLRESLAKFFHGRCGVG